MRHVQWALAVVLLLVLLSTGCASMLSGGGDDNDNNPPPAEQNDSPSITAIGATPSSIAPNGNVTLSVTATDPDGDALSYTWSGTGTFATATAASTQWQHTAVGSFTLNCAVSDGNGHTVTGAVAVQVAPPAPGNNVPVFGEDGITHDVSAPVAGQKVLLSVEVSDPDNDALNVTWDDGAGAANFTDAAFAGGVASAAWTPPAAGDYNITVTADDGKVSAAAKQVFVTGTATLAVTVAAMPTEFDVVGYETCGTCHSGTVDEWLTTNHHDALERTINPNPHGYRNEGCYVCHAVGYEPVGENGFVDQDLTPQFANIQCEACHGGGNPPGAGGGHKPSPWDPGLGYQRDESGAYVMDGETYLYDAAYDGSEGYGCGLCHEGSRHGSFEEWAESTHATYALTEDDDGTIVVGPPGEANCVRCHNGKYFVSVTIEGGDPPAEDFTPEQMTDDMHITCATCHDPHNGQYEAQLRISAAETVTLPIDETQAINGGRGNICITCHNGRRSANDFNNYITNPGSRFGFHGNSQANMLFAIGGVEFEGYEYAKKHPHETWNENSCVTCHMYRRDYIDSDNPALWGHNFEPRFERCITCHTNYTIDQEAEFWTWVDEWVAAEVTPRLAAFVAAWPAEWKDVTDPESPNLRFKESAEGAGDGPVVGDPTGDEYRRCLWNYRFVEAEVSRGVHNPTYTVELLDSAIAELNALNEL